jgi:hypothetical protein
VRPAEWWAYWRAVFSRTGRDAVEIAGVQRASVFLAACVVWVLQGSLIYWWKRDPAPLGDSVLDALTALASTLGFFAVVWIVRAIAWTPAVLAKETARLPTRPPLTLVYLDNDINCRSQRLNAEHKNTTDEREICIGIVNPGAAVSHVQVAAAGASCLPVDGRPLVGHKFARYPDRQLFFHVPQSVGDTPSAYVRIAAVTVFGGLPDALPELHVDPHTMDPSGSLEADHAVQLCLRIECPELETRLYALLFARNETRLSVSLRSITAEELSAITAMSPDP